MNKAIIAALLMVSAVLLAGCASPQQGADQQANGSGNAGITPLVQRNQLSADESAALDADLNDMQGLIDDSNLDQVDFIEVDEISFK